MKEFKVGIRIGDDGLSFTGIDEVNSVINRGGKVASVQPGGAVMRKIGEDGENVSLTLAGCDMTIVVDDSDVDSSPETLEHDRLYKEGTELIRPYMELVGGTNRSADSDEARDKLQRGIELLRGAIEITPANWAAYWQIGKAYQAMEDLEQACDAFKEAFRLHKGNADVAREYMFECLKLGRTRPGIAAARHAVNLKPEDAGLKSNLALALLVGAELDEAAEVIEQAMSLDSEDPITQSLKRVIADVKAGKRPQPKTLLDLHK